MLKAKQVGCPIISLYRDIEILSSHSGGWWYKICANTNLTGQHTKTRSKIGGKQIFYYHGGQRGKGVDSWSEVNMLLLPNWASFPSLFFIWSVCKYIMKMNMRQLWKVLTIWLKPGSWWILVTNFVFFSFLNSLCSPVMRCLWFWLPNNYFNQLNLISCGVIWRQHFQS